MKLLLTSLGLTNESIRTAPTELTGKPISESSVAFLPTAMHAMPSGGGTVRCSGEVKGPYEVFGSLFQQQSSASPELP